MTPDSAPRGPETVAVFDLDGTITRTDTYRAFLLQAMLRRPGRTARLMSLPWTASQFKLGLISRGKVKARFLAAVLGGLTREAIQRRTDAFTPFCLNRMVKPAALDQVRWHRDQGHRLILATASLDLYVEPLGQALGFDQVIGTKAQWRDGRLTGALDGPNLLGEDKLDAVRAILETPGPRPEVFAYSDHHSDLPLLRYADHALAVDPTPRLQAAIPGTAIEIRRWL